MATASWRARFKVPWLRRVCNVSGLHEREWALVPAVGDGVRAVRRPALPLHCSGDGSLASPASRLLLHC